MPLDDLDRLLEMELGCAPEGRKISEQVSSLEAQVLSRVQQACTTEERTPVSPLNREASPPTANAVLDPVYQYADALLPIIDLAHKLLEDRAENRAGSELAMLRTQLAERLLALPEVKLLDKPGIFAAMATCIDAANFTESESRRAARERLEKLMQGLAAARSEADRQRLQAIDRFLQEI